MGAVDDFMGRFSPTSALKNAEQHIEVTKEQLKEAHPLYELYDLNKTVFDLLQKVDFTLTFGVFNRKGGSGKTPIICFLALLLQFIVGSKPVLLGDANTSMSTAPLRLSTPIDPNKLSFKVMAEDLVTMREILANPSEILPPPKFMFTSYNALEAVTHTTPSRLLLISNPPSYPTSLSVAQATLEWAITHVYATFFDSGNTIDGSFDEAAFRASNLRFFVCRGPKMDSVNGLVTTMKQYYDRGYEACVIHAPILLTEASLSIHSAKSLYQQMCVVATPPAPVGKIESDEDVAERRAKGVAEIARLGVTKENCEEKIFMIPFICQLSDRNATVLPRLNVNPTNGDGFTPSEEFTDPAEVRAVIAAVKFLKALIEQGPPPSEDVAADFKRAEANIKDDIERRKGHADTELEFFNPERLSQHYSLVKEGYLPAKETTPAQPKTAAKRSATTQAARNRRTAQTPTEESPVT